MESVGHLRRCLASNRSRRPQRGLSALEMVLSLPMLLFVMALMINYGTVASWKVRANVASRYKVWGSRVSGPEDQPFNLPQPTSWPPPATFGASGAGDDAAMDDPRVNLPIARGPTLLDGTTVNTTLLDPARGFRVGTSTIHRDYPVMLKIGPYTLDSRANMLDDKWQFWGFGWGDYQVWRNDERRIPVIWALAQAPAGDSQAYVQAVLAILFNPLRNALLPLDADVVWHGFHMQFPLPPPRGISDSPDFQPQLPGYCSVPNFCGTQRWCGMDPVQVQPAVDNLILSIQGGQGRDSVAKTMTKAFHRHVPAGDPDPAEPDEGQTAPPANQIAAMQAEIQQAQQQIDVLTKFLQTLP